MAETNDNALVEVATTNCVVVGGGPAGVILAGTPGLRWVLPTIIGWGVRPARVKAVAESPGKGG